MPMSVRILLADDHAILRSGLHLLIESHPGYTLVAQAEDAEQAVALAEEHRPDVAILDITMPGGGGVRACERILAVCPDTRVISLTMHEDPAYLKAALAAGANAYVLKRSADTCLMEAVEAVSDGRIYIDPALGAQVMQEMFDRRKDADDSAPSEGLSVRERQVLFLLAHGYTNKEAAGELGLSMRSIETYRSRMAEKMGFQSRKEMVRYALEIGLLKPGDQIEPSRER